jgi:DNA polymerase V
MKVEKSLNIKTSYSFEAPLYNVASKLGLIEKDTARIDSFDLSNYLVSDYENTFLVRVIGDSMINENIYEGDILVVNKKEQPKDGKVVIASLNGEMAVKRFRKIEGKVYLYSANKKFLPIEILPYCQFEIQGIVKHVIKNF